MLTLKTLKSPAGAHRNTKRLGRGQGSGQGTQAGKGHKGQNARKSGNTRIGFEGGSMPIFMRLPKRGFKNYPFRTDYAIFNLKVIEQYFTNEDVSKETLISKGLLKGSCKSLPIKILGVGQLSKSVNFVNIDKFTKTAEAAILKAGGKIVNSK